MTEITQSIVAPILAADLFGRADELLDTLLSADRNQDGLSLTMRKTSPSPLGVGSTFRATVRASGLPLGVELRCTEYTPPRRVTVQSVNGLPLALTLTFQPHPDGTQVTALVRYDPPPGLAGVLWETFAPPAKIEQRLKRGLERLQEHLTTPPDSR